MRIRWDEKKRREVVTKRSIDFACLDDLLDQPYIEDQLIDDPRQHRIIGLAQGVLTTFVVEHREDETGEFLWVVTGWRSTREERRAYEQETH